MVVSGATCVRQVGTLASRVAPEAAPRRAVPVWAIVSAGLSPAVMTVAWLVADTLQPASYSPLRQTVSVLAGQAGADRWIVTGALFLIGGLQFRGGRWPDWDQRARAARPAAPQARSAARSLALA